MSKICEITGKKPSAGNNRSKAMNATRRRFMPNLVTKKVTINGVTKRMKISTKALKTLTKNAK